MKLIKIIFATLVTSTCIANAQDSNSTLFLRSDNGGTVDITLSNNYRFSCTSSEITVSFQRDNDSNQPAFAYRSANAIGEKVSLFNSPESYDVRIIRPDANSHTSHTQVIFPIPRGSDTPLESIALTQRFRNYRLVSNYRPTAIQSRMRNVDAQINSNFSFLQPTENYDYLAAQHCPDYRAGRTEHHNPDEELYEGMTTAP